MQEQGQSGDVCVPLLRSSQCRDHMATLPWWRDSLTRPMLLLSGEFLLHAPCYVMWGISLTHTLCCYLGTFSYTLHAILCGEFPLHAPCYYYLDKFSYTPHAVLCGEFLLHTPSCIMWGVSLPRPMQLLCG